MGANEVKVAFNKLESACRLLEEGAQHDIAAVTSEAMAMLARRYGIGGDHIIERAS